MRRRSARFVPFPRARRRAAPKPRAEN